MADRASLGRSLVWTSLAFLAGCDAVGGSAANRQPHPPDICARTDPFARALERELQSAAAITASDRPVGDSVERYPVTVRVSGLRLDSAHIVSDDGTAVECGARWSGVVHITPSRAMRSVVEASPEREGQQRRFTQPLRRVRLPIAGSTHSFRALWQSTEIRVYGDLGVRADAIVSQLLGQATSSGTPANARGVSSGHLPSKQGPDLRSKSSPPQDFAN